LWDYYLFCNAENIDIHVYDLPHISINIKKDASTCSRKELQKSKKQNLIHNRIAYRQTWWLNKKTFLEFDLHDPWNKSCKIQEMHLMKKPKHEHKFCASSTNYLMNHKCFKQKWKDLRVLAKQNLCIINKLLDES